MFDSDPRYSETVSGWFSYVIIVLSSHFDASDPNTYLTFLLVPWAVFPPPGFVIAFLILCIFPSHFYFILMLTLIMALL